MCLNPISIVNPTKYISLKYRDMYLLQVPCGVCAECQTSLSNQWNYRVYYEFMDCLKAGGANFIMFDTLTYDNEHLPKISQVFNDVTDVDDFSCFRPKDVTDFLKNLRIRLNRDLSATAKLRYFLTSEYGHDQLYQFHGQLRKGTNRPHYHILFFVYNSDEKQSQSDKFQSNQTKSNYNSLTVDPLAFSQLVSKCWIYGQTDGFPYHSSSYVLEHNIIATSSLSNILRTAGYVSKYVQKSCEFKKELDARMFKTMNNFAQKFNPSNPDKWLESLAAARIQRKLKSLVNQFHRQSLHFGESALSEMDLNQIFKDGYLVMPHYKNVKVKVAVSTYYKRKLFYRLVEIDGAKSWQLNETGIAYKAARDKKLCHDLESRLQCVCIQHHLNYDCKELADYVMHYRGRIKAPNPPSTIEQRVQQLDLFNYVTLSDKEQLMVRGLTPRWCGNSSLGYNTDVMPPYITIKDFITKYVELDLQKEKELSHIYYLLSFVDKGKQDAYELKQRLTQLYSVFL